MKHPTSCISNTQVFLQILQPMLLHSNEVDWAMPDDFYTVLACLSFFSYSVIWTFPAMDFIFERNSKHILCILK